MIRDKQYEALFNDYKDRIKEEKLALKGKCTMSLRLSDILFMIVNNVSAKRDIVYKDIQVIGIVNASEDKEYELHRQIYLNNKQTNAIIHAYPEYCASVGETGVSIPAMLDDMAQIIGTSAKTSENNINSIIKNLKKRSACIIKGDGVIATGRTLDEAYVGCLVLEKSAKCYIDVTVLGSYKKINYPEAVLMHYVYRKKYSKANQSMLSGQITGGSEENIDYSIYSERELELRKQIKDAGIRLLKSNLVQGTWGNISIRLDDDHMLITPSGLDYLSLKIEDMAVVNLNTMEYSGARKPSGEKDIHAIMLKSRPDINVVMHSHPTECSAFAVSRVNLPVMSEAMEKYVKGDAKVSSYALPSTKKLAHATVTAMKGRNACFMANHGMLSVGKDIDEAFETCRVMEDSARAYIDMRAAELSKAEGSGIAKRKDVFNRKYLKKF